MLTVSCMVRLVPRMEKSGGREAESNRPREMLE